MFFKVVGRITASFLQGLGKGFYGFFNWVGKHPVTFLITVGVFLSLTIAIWGFNLFGLADGSFTGSNQAVVKPLERTLEPDSKSVEFLNALKDANATKLYDALDADYKKVLKERGITSAGAMQIILNQQLEQATNKKNTKLNYQFNFIIGTKYSDGSVENDFTGQISGAAARSNLEYVFKIKGGKVLQLQTTDPLVIALLGTNKTASGEDAQIGAVANRRNATTEDFMVGLTTFDADKIWATLSDSYKLELKERNVTRDSMATIFDKMVIKPNSQSPPGQKIGYEGFIYNETINFPNGVASHIYVSIFSFDDKPNQIYYLLVVDKDSKIIKIGYAGGGTDQLLEIVLGRGQKQQ